MSRTGVRLRHARASDLAAVVALERATAIAPHWPPEAYSGILDASDAAPVHGSASASGAPRRCLIVAEDPAQTDGAIAGFAVGLMHPAPPACDSATLKTPACVDRVAELESIVVAASARRAGIGSDLSSAVLNWLCSQGATEVLLEVRAGSIAAIALYAGLGFAHAGRRPHYYNNPEEDALILRLKTGVH
jgi:ribosomal-protein-alanine N-acetyltransferase